MKKTKIVNIFLAGCSDIYGGPIRSTYGLSKIFQKQDIEVNLYSQAVKNESSEVRTITKFKGTCYKRRSILFKCGFAGFIHGYRSHKNAINIINGIWHPYYLFVLIGLRFNKNNTGLIFSRGSLSGHTVARKNKLKLLFLSLFIGLSRGFKYIATSTTEQSDIKKYIGSDVKILPNILDIPLHHQLIEPQINKSDVTHFIFVSRIEPGKGILELLEALTFLQGNWHLSIYGRDEKGILSEFMKSGDFNALGPKVTIGAHISNDLVLQKLRTADCLVLPSKSENFGNIVVESFSQGTPVITTVHTPWTDLEEKELGFLCEVTPQSIRQAMERFMELSIDEKARLNKRALDYYRNNLSDEVLSQKCLELIYGY